MTKHWIENNQPDEYFHLAHSFSSAKEESDFKNTYGEHIIFPVIIVNSPCDIFYSKAEVIQIIEDNGGILFEYIVQSDSGGWPEFSVMIPNDQALLEKITMAIAQYTDRDEYLTHFDFCEVTDSPKIKNILP